MKATTSTPNRLHPAFGSDVMTMNRIRKTISARQPRAVEHQLGYYCDQPREQLSSPWSGLHPGFRRQSHARVVHPFDTVEQCAHLGAMS